MGHLGIMTRPFLWLHQQASGSRIFRARIKQAGPQWGILSAMPTREGTGSLDLSVTCLSLQLVLENTHQHHGMIPAYPEFHKGT